MRWTENVWKRTLWEQRVKKKETMVKQTLIFFHFSRFFKINQFIDFFLLTTCEVIRVSPSWFFWVSSVTSYHVWKNASALHEFIFDTMNILSTSEYLCILLRIAGRKSEMLWFHPTPCVVAWTRELIVILTCEKSIMGCLQKMMWYQFTASRFLKRIFHSWKY